VIYVIACIVFALTVAYLYSEQRVDLAKAERRRAEAERDEALSR